MYDIDQHKHNYSLWAASRAWNRRLGGGNYDLAKKLIDIAKLEGVRGPDDIYPDVDLWLLEKMTLIVDHAAQNNVSKITYGRAQKLVNIYLKTKLICGGHASHPKVGLLHPPIDSQLLDGLRDQFRLEEESVASIAFKEAQNNQPSWTYFGLEDYMAHINAIKLYMDGQPLWMVEKHWKLS